MEPSPGRARADARGLLRHPPTGDPERRNRAFWDADADAYQAAHGEALTRAPMAWGVWRIPEAELGVLGDVRGLDVLEYGCGGAQWSVALAASGARAVGLDLSRTQLSHARRLVRQAAAGVALVCATATAAPFVDASFDLVFCDHGAMSFDYAPRRWARRWPGEEIWCVTRQSRVRRGR